MTISKNTSMFSGADFPPLPSKNDVLLRDSQHRVAKAEEELAKALAEKDALKTKLVNSLRRLKDEQDARPSTKRLIPFSQWRNPTTFMKMEAALYTMAKNDKEISALRLKHGIDEGCEAKPLLPGQTTEQRNWHTWLSDRPDGSFKQQPGWGIEADEAWETWLNHLDEMSARVVAK